MSHKV